MFDFTAAPVAVRPDLTDAYEATWDHLANPGTVLTSEQRNELLTFARTGGGSSTDRLVDTLAPLAATLYTEPAAVTGALVRNTADDVGDAAVVEVIAITSMLAAVDGTHRGLGVEVAPLPTPRRGTPSGQVRTDLKPRRTHVPMPRGAIPTALDLLPSESAAFQSLFGPQYMTDAEMAHDDYERSPGLNRAQMELISSRTSLINKCFY